MSFRFRYLFAVTMLCMICVCGLPSVSAQVPQLQEIVGQKANWKKFAEDGRKVQFEGRFQGRADDTFQLHKFDLPCRLPSNIKLPERMKINQCLDVTGKFLIIDGRLGFLISRLVVRDTDLERLSKLAASTPIEQTDELLSLAQTFDSTADYYDDKLLKQEIAAVRTQAIAEKRKRAAGRTDQLRPILQLAESLSLDVRLQQSLQFEILLSLWKQPSPDIDELISEVKKLDGWDRQLPEVPERLTIGFDQKATSLYDQGPESDRQWLHRLFYITLRQQQIRAMLKVDGSNGLMLADLLRREFPGESSIAAELEQSEVQYRLARVAILSRQEFQQLLQLLERLSKSDQIPGVINQWLKAQEKQFGTETLVGLLRTADEYLYVAEQQKGGEFQARAIELLKQAWAMASAASPDDARQIADRLKRLGWEHLNGQWMTAQQVQMLPKDDVQLAIREGRVVRGMSAIQVSQTLGQPARISRVSSARSMRELWIYDTDGSAGMVVRFRKGLMSKTEEMVVEEVSRISSSAR